MIRRLLILFPCLFFSIILLAQDDSESENVSFKILKSEAKIDTMNGGGMYWKDLTQIGKINVTDCPGCEISGFDLSFVAFKSNHGDSGCVDPELSALLHSDSAGFTDNMLKVIKKAKEGKCIFFNITAYTPDDVKVDLNKIVLYIYPVK